MKKVNCVLIDHGDLRTKLLDKVGSVKHLKGARTEGFCRDLPQKQ